MVQVAKRSDNVTTDGHFVLKWKMSMGHRGWPRYEVRPMSAMEDDPDWSVVAKDLSFKKADRMRIELELKEKIPCCIVGSISTIKSRTQHR